MRTYQRFLCDYCGKQISTAGAAKVAHYRKHVREGILREIKLDWQGKYPRVRFERVKE